jgi:hypothetical protein
MGIFPLGCPLDPDVQHATLKCYLDLAPDYLGSPMCSALYGVWAAYHGDRDLAARMIDEGYGQFCVNRFAQTLEYRRDVFPEQPSAGPQILGAFCMAFSWVSQAFARVQNRSPNGAGARSCSRRDGKGSK